MESKEDVPPKMGNHAKEKHDSAIVPTETEGTFEGSKAASIWTICGSVSFYFVS